MELLILIGRTAFFNIFLLLLFRFMPKRDIGQLRVMDKIVFIMMSEVATIAIEKDEVSILKGMIPILTLGILQYGIALIALKSRWFRKLLDGEAIIVIENGKIKDTAMRKMRYTIDDLLLQLREKEVMDVSEVQFAVLETNGKLSVIKKDTANTKNTKQNLLYPLIMDGEIITPILKKIGKNEKWLYDAIKKSGYESVHQIFYCSYVDGKLFIDPYDTISYDQK